MNAEDIKIKVDKKIPVCHPFSVLCIYVVTNCIHYFDPQNFSFSADVV